MHAINFNVHVSNGLTNVFSGNTVKECPKCAVLRQSELHTVLCCCVGICMHCFSIVIYR